MNNRSEKKHCGKEHRPLKHMLHMILCCGLPIVIILSLRLIAGISPAIAGVLGIIAPFICPVMMGGMFFMMYRRNKNNCCDEVHEGTNKELTSND